MDYYVIISNDPFLLQITRHFTFCIIYLFDNIFAFSEYLKILSNKLDKYLRAYSL